MEYKNRKTTRLAIFDYNTIGAYFITFNTQNKEHLLSKVIRKDIFVRTDVLDGPTQWKNIKFYEFVQIKI